MTVSPLGSRMDSPGLRVQDRLARASLHKQETTTKRLNVGRPVGVQASNRFGRLCLYFCFVTNSFPSECSIHSVVRISTVGFRGAQNSSKDLCEFYLNIWASFDVPKYIGQWWVQLHWGPKPHRRGGPLHKPSPERISIAFEKISERAIEQQDCK